MIVLGGEKEDAAGMLNLRAEERPAEGDVNRFKEQERGLAYAALPDETADRREGQARVDSARRQQGTAS